MTSIETAAAQGDMLPKISAPAQRALEHAGITRLSQLTQFTRDDLLKLHGMGTKALGILEQALAQKGMAFAPSQSAM